MKTEFLVQFISSLSMLSMFTYIPYWANIIGLTNQEITLVAVYYGISIFATNLIVGRLSDLIGLRKPFIIIGLMITSVSIFTLILPTNFIEFSITRIFTGIGYGIYIPTLTALVTDKNLKLGKFSGAGTAAWAVGVIISGVIGIFWVPGIFIFSSFVLLGSFFIAFTIKEVKTPLQKYQYSSIRVFIQRKRAFTAFITRHSLANAVWVLWPLYMVSLGANEFDIALIQVLNPVTSSIIMSRFTDRINSKLMISLGLIMTSITFFGYFMATVWYFLLPIQILLGFSWAFIYVGVLRYSVESTEFDKSTITGWINSIQSISVIIGSALSFTVIYFGGTITNLILLSCFGSFLMFLVNYVLDLKERNIEIIPSDPIIVKPE